MLGFKRRDQLADRCGRDRNELLPQRSALRSGVEFNVGHRGVLLPGGAWLWGWCTEKGGWLADCGIETGAMDSPLSARQGLDQLVALHKRGAGCIRTQTESARLSGTGDSAYAALEIARLAESLPVSRRPLVAVVRDETEARLLRRDLAVLPRRWPRRRRRVCGVGAEPARSDTSPWADVSPERSAILRRMSVLFRLSQGGEHAGLVLVASLRALARRVVPFLSLAGLVKKLHVNHEINRDDLIDFLRQGGYTRAPVCEDPGTLAVRGGVLDLFVPLYPFPVRVDFYGDLVESLRFFDPATQRSLRKTTEIFLHPVRETILTEGHRLRERLLEAADLSGHPSARTRQIQEQIEAGEGLLWGRVTDPAFHASMGSLREYLPDSPTFYLCAPHALTDALTERFTRAARRHIRSASPIGASAFQRTTFSDARRAASAL